MKKNQTGEVMLAVMVVMLAVALLSRGHFGMMGHGHGHVAQSAETMPQSPTAPAPKPESGQTAAPQR